MRGILQLTMGAVATAAMVLFLGCGDREDDRRQPPPQASAPAPATNTRVNLYPLTAPPTGTTQPVQGYAPTRITGGGAQQQQYYGPESSAMYADRGVVYGPNAGSAGGAPFAGTNFAGTTQFATPTGYCTVEEMTANTNPLVPISDPPVVVTGPGGRQQMYSSRDRSYLSSVGTGERAGPGGVTYGSVEGTADIALPVGGYPSGYSGSTGYTTTTTTTYGTTTYMPAPTPVTTVNYAPTTTYAPPSTVPAYGTTTTTYGATTTYAPPAQYVPPPTATYAPPLSSTYPTPAPAPGSATTYPLSAAAPAASAGTASGYQLVPAPDIPPGNRPGDAAPSQWFEIIRPGNGPIRIGRVSATCVCVGVRVPNRQVAAGERALIEARTLSRPPANNLTYGIYVGIVEPVQATVDADVTIRY